MASDPDDLGDSRSRQENRRYRGMAERLKSADPLYACVPRWIPTGNWRLSGFDLLVIVVGATLILMILGMRLLGIIG